MFVALAYIDGGGLGSDIPGYPVKTYNPFEKPWPLSANTFGDADALCLYPFERVDGCSPGNFGAIVSFANPGGGVFPGHMGILLADNVLIYAGGEAVKLGTWERNQRGKLPGVVRVYKP